MKLVITVDTEADNQWDVRAPLATENLACVPRFQALCERFGFPPTYLCTHEVVTSTAFDESLASAARRGRAEVGAHLHPWSTPPADETWDAASRARPYPSELPVELLAAKLETLTAVIADRMGARPTSYRAGRWGFSAPQIPLLEQLGYVADCSVTPGVSWRRDVGLRDGGPDFTVAPVTPYALAAADPCRNGSSGIVEVPVTIVHTNGLMRRFGSARASYRHHRRSLAWRAADRFFQVAPQWLRPFPHMTADRLIAVCDTARQLELPVLQMMLHSSELLPGGSPYNDTPAAVDNLHDRLAAVFRHLAACGTEGATLTGAARDWRAGALGG